MKHIKSVILFVLAAYSASAFALFGGGGFGGIVFDPTNFAKNTLTSIHAVNQEIREQLRVIQDLKNISNALSDVPGIVAAASGLQDVIDLVKVTTQLKSELESMGQVANTFKTLYGASNAGTAQEFIALLAKREKAGDASVKALMDNAQEMQKKIERTSEQHQRLAASLSSIEGVTQAAISTTAAVGIVVQQNQAILSYYQNLEMTDAAKMAKDNAVELNLQKDQLNYRREMNRRLSPGN